MKKFILLTLLGSCLTSIALTQVGDHYVIAAQGGSATSHTLSVDWTLGDLVTTSAYTTDEMFTQGFHQPYLTVKELVSYSPQISTRGTIKTELEYVISVSPNPSSSTLTVQFKGPEDQTIDLFISDVSGKKILAGQIAMGSDAAQLNISDLAAGLYILSCYSVEKGLLNAFKISKI